MKTREEGNEPLKESSKSWWSVHPQDYVDPGVTDHLGVDTELDNESFELFLRSIDNNSRLNHYYAQSRGGVFFERLIPQDLSGKRVLEVGCGLGGHTEALARTGALVEAIDLSPTSIANTRRRLALRGLAGNVEEADAEALPFEDNTFDFVWSWGVIHHSPNTKKCASEITRVLKPGGRLHIMLYHRSSLYNWVNVIFRYGILQGKLFTMSIQDLHNRYTDGKKIGGVPLAKYYTKKEIREDLFPEIHISRQIAFEQKHAISFWVPGRFRRKFENLIPDNLYAWFWRKLGFLIHTEGVKR